MSSFNLYIFWFFLQTYLMIIEMIFRLNLVSYISILKLVIPINGSRHDFMGSESILRRNLAIYTLQLSIFISIYFLYFQICFYIYLLISLWFFLRALRSLRVCFNYFDFVIDLKLIWIACVVVDNYVFNLQFFIFEIIFSFLYLFKFACIPWVHLLHLLLCSIFNFLEINGHIFLYSILFPIRGSGNHFTTKFILIA